MSKMLSNQKIINEIKASQIDYVKTRPEMIFKPFVNNRSERDYNLGDGGKRQEHKRDLIGGYKSLGQHPRFSNSVNGNTAFPDPLFGGAVKGEMYNNYLAFNNRGGALLGEKMPLEGGIKADCDFYSESDSDSENSSSESESESDKSESDYESDEDMEGGEMCKGAGIYDDYIKPAGKALLNTGKAVFKDIVVPVGKEILKDTIKGVLMGAGKKGGLSGTKKEFIHILKAMHPDIDFSKKKKKELMEEIKKSIPTTDFIPPLQTTEPRKRGRPKSDKPKAEANPRGRPKSDKPKAEPKKRGRPSKIKSEEPIESNKKSKVEELDEIFKNILEKKEDINEPEPEPEPKPKQIKKPTKTQLKAERIERDKIRKKSEIETKKFEKLDKERLKIVIKRDNLQEKLDNAKKQDTKKKYEAEVDKYNKQLQEFDIKNNYKPYGQRQKEKYSKIFNNEGAGIKKIVGTKKGERVRGDIVAEVMKKQGLSLGQASKYVSQHNLY